MIVTVVCAEKSSPRPPVSPWPLIYTLEVIDTRDKNAIRRQIAAIRYDEIFGGTEEQDGDMIDAICEGIEVHFVFEDDLSTLEDFRQ